MLRNFHKELISIYQMLKLSDFSTKKYNEILSICNKVLNKKSILLYKLNIALSQYELIAGLNVPHEVQKSYPFDIQNNKGENNSFFIKDFKNLVTGWIDFSKADAFTNMEIEYINLICEIASSEFENDWVNNLFTKIITPVKLTLPEQDYYHEICKVAGEASNMKFAALRIYDQVNDTLPCIAVYGNNVDTKRLPIDQLSFSRENRLFDLFSNVMNGPIETCLVYNQEDNPVVSEITRFELFRNVKTIVIAPLVVGDNPLGTVSFGIEHNMDFTYSQKKGFLSISNSVGAAISNYIETNTRIEYQTNIFDRFRSAVNEEVLHGLRHSLRNSLHNMYGQIKNIESFITKKKFTQANEELSLIKATYLQAIHAVNAQASITTISPKYDNQNLVTVFEKAVELVKPTLTNNNIKVKYQHGHNFVAYVDEDSLKYAFLNLLLNSIDALKKESKTGRQISLNIMVSGDKYKMIFADSGCGFMAKPPDIINPRDIFKPGTTTKKHGTGYGLPYVSLVIQKNHEGSIRIFNIGESNSGMAFEIELYKDFRRIN